MKKSILTILVISITTFLGAQEALKSIEEEYYDFLSLQGLVERPTLGYRTLSDSKWELSEDTEHVWQNNNLGTTKTLWEAEEQNQNWFTKGIYEGFKVKFYGPEWYNSYNTHVPYGQNDGALWQGVGYNTSITGGVRAEGYGFEVTLKPQVVFSQNKEFDTLFGKYVSSWPETGSIDWVQRYGDKSFFDYSFGDSEIRYNFYNFTVGFGTQSPWLGTAQLNPMLGSNNAAPYFKLDAGIKKTEVFWPFGNVDLGTIEGRVWVGTLEQSEYFNGYQIYTDGNRVLIGLSASYSPSFIPNFTVGLNRVFVTYWNDNCLKYLGRLFTASRANGYQDPTNIDEDQKFAFFFDWLFPKVGFEVYGEFGRDDFSSDEKASPFHTAIYTVGLKQILPFPKNLKSELCFEWNNFEISQDFQLQWTYAGYYAHGAINQGYTNKGQILGAGTGSLGNSQYLQYKVYYPQGYTALKFHRYCPNNNAVYNKAVYTSADCESDFYWKWYGSYETYFIYGIEQNIYINKDFDITGNVNYIHVYNYNFDKKLGIRTFSTSLNFKYNF